MVAKKAKTEGVLARETRLRAEADAIAAERTAAEKATKDKAAMDKAAKDKAAANRSAPPVPKPARPAKVKKARFVRAPQEKRVPAKVAAVPARSRKAAGKLMTKNVTARPKDDSTAWPRSADGATRS
jgi:colicin import membrane protein